MPEHVLRSLVGVADAEPAGCLAAAEFAAQSDFSLRFGFVRQQAGGHGAGVNEHERGVEQARYARRLGKLRRVRDWMEGCTDRKRALAPSGVDIDDHAA